MLQKGQKARFYNSLLFSAESIFSHKADISAESTFSSSCSLACSRVFWCLSRSSTSILLMRLHSARFPPFVACLCACFSVPHFRRHCVPLCYPCGLVICVLWGFLCVFGIFIRIAPFRACMGLFSPPFAVCLVLINTTKRAGAGAGVSLSHSLALCCCFGSFMF